MARSTTVTMFFHKMSSKEIQSNEERKTVAVKFLVEDVSKLSTKLKMPYKAQNATFKDME